MKEGITSTGFNYAISEEVANDWELLEALSEMDENKSKLVTVVKRALGDEGYKALKEHCREGTVVSTERMSAEITEVFKSFNELKNS